MGSGPAVSRRTPLVPLPEVRDPRLSPPEKADAFTPYHVFTDKHLTLTAMAEPTTSYEFRLEKLDKDYKTWAALFTASLQEKLLWGAIGDPAPNATTNPADHAEWVIKDQRAYARLMLSTELHHLPTIQACNSATEAWDALEEMFTAQNNARRLQLGQELAKLKLKPGESLMAYSGRTEKLQTAMIAAGHPIDNNTAILHFLMRLGPEYEMEKKILTRMSRELRWTSMLCTLYPVEEAAAEATTASEGPTVAAFYVSGLRDALPSWPKDKPMPRSERRRRVVCWNCSRRGHFSHECQTTTDRPHGSGGGPSASFMVTTTKKPRKPSVAGPSVDATMSPLSNPTDHKWLIDSGASNNRKPTATGLTNNDAGGSEVTVANGQTLDSPGRGSIAIATSLGGAVTLTDTMLVPRISTNLFSVRAADRAGGGHPLLPGYLHNQAERGDRGHGLRERGRAKWARARQRQQEEDRTGAAAHQCRLRQGQPQGGPVAPSVWPSRLRKRL